MTSYHHAGPVGIGIIGAGTISVEYLTNLTSFPDVVVHIVGDLFPEAAQKRAEEFGVPASGTTQDVLDHPDVEIVINLTVPVAHAEVRSGERRVGKEWSAGGAVQSAADVVQSTST